MKNRNAALIGAFLVLFALPTFAQQGPSATERPEFRKWDVSSTLGIVSSPTDFSGLRRPRHTELGFVWNIDAGRYFTPHWKAEVGLMWTNAREFYDGHDNLGYTNGTVYPVSVSGAVTYQFLENVFAHPYVSAGIRVTSMYEDITTVRFSSTFETSTVSSGSRRFTQARPFVAAGYKSYFNERVYIRSDFLIAIDKIGLSHGTLRAGVGVDF
jgi:hypothetical protein